MKRTTLVLLGSFLALAACDSTPPDPVETVAVTPGSLAVGIGQSRQLDATATTVGGSDVDPSKINWGSTDEQVATVDATGLVTGVGQGQAEIIASVGAAADTAVVSVGPLVFNANAFDACTDPDFRAGRVVAETDNAIIVEDIAAPANGFSAADYQEIAQEFETNVYPTVTANFGTPTDIDGNGKVYIFYTNAVNELTDPGEDSYIGGFFYARDLFPSQDTTGFQGCPASNVAEIFYMLVPDPTGEINENQRTADFVRRVTIGTLAHEFEHLINASRRLYVNDAVRQDGSWAEVAWLDEGLAHIAEELVFYADAGMAPESNITGSDDTDGGAQIDTDAEREAFNEFQISNFIRFNNYLLTTEDATFFGLNDDLETRGSTWSFLRYAADRSTASPQTPIWHQLVRDATTFGFTNLEGPFGQNVETWMTDWAIAHYTDDLVTTDAVYRHPSWDFRYVLGQAIQDSNGNPVGFDLTTRSLVATDTLAFTVNGGGAAYIEFAVPASTTAELVVVADETTSGTSCLSGGPTISLAVGQVHRTTWGNSGYLCLAQQPAAADYALIPVVQVTSPTSFVGLKVSGTNVVAPTPSANVLATFDRRPAFPVASIQRLQPDERFEALLRRRERIELSPHVEGASARFSVGPARMQVSPTTDLQLAIVRVR